MSLYPPFFWSHRSKQIFSNRIRKYNRLTLYCLIYKIKKSDNLQFSFLNICLQTINFFTSTWINSMKHAFTSAGLVKLWYTCHSWHIEKSPAHLNFRIMEMKLGGSATYKLHQSTFTQALKHTLFCFVFKRLFNYGR